MLCGGATTATYVLMLEHQECVLLQYIELEVAHDTHDIISTIIIIDDSIHSKLEVLVALNIMAFHGLPIPYSGKFLLDKIIMDGSKNENSRMLVYHAEREHNYA